ncbi:hypothetical protein [Rhodococcus sp. ACT016]|uniref:hypothetical protein n=1 Tax=Rhodococcus sp. ACT016 TaxID=3134808 RepID=UPI003D2DB44A
MTAPTDECAPLRERADRQKAKLDKIAEWAAVKRFEAAEDPAKRTLSAFEVVDELRALLSGKW